MATKRAPKDDVSFHPATHDRWADLEGLFGARGACGGCWCTFWRLSSRDYNEGRGDANKARLRRWTKAEVAPGILAYRGAEAVGWCAVAPRADYTRLSRSRTLAPVDAAETWSVTCFFVAKAHRRQGLTVKLLEAACKHARKHGARIVEGYPVESRKGAMPDAFAFTGLPGAFRAAGFEEVLRRSPTRPIMRRHLDAKPRASRARRKAR